jgi:hypothetical protein
LVGSDYGAISNAYSTGFVSGAEYTGGLVGYANTNAVLTSDYSTVTTSPYLTPYASGGLVGFNGGTISDKWRIKHFTPFKNRLIYWLLIENYIVKGQILVTQHFGKRLDRGKPYFRLGRSWSIFSFGD